MRSVFEYRIERFEFKCILGQQDDKLEDIMNEYGEDRWEVIKISQNTISLDDKEKEVINDYYPDGTTKLKIKVWGSLYLKRANEIV